MRRLDTDGGAVAVLVAILLVPLVGLGAYAVDVAALYSERRELQSGADAAALAIAEDCARERIPCVPDAAEGVARTYADANARDGASAVESVTLDVAEARVTVVTRSRDPARGRDTVTHFLAQVLGRNESAVRATATARWDVAPASLKVFPLAFCLEVFNRLTDGGTFFGPVDHPGYHVFYKTPGTPLEECPEAGYPGGFGWLETDEHCETTVAEDAWHPGYEGATLPSAGWAQACIDLIDAAIADPDSPPLLVPLFDEWAGQGNASGRFHLVGFGAFRPTGYRFSGTNTNPDAHACREPDNRCVRGWFTEFITLDGTGSGGRRHGVTTVQLER